MKKNIGIYVHIPFCASKCAYCDFYSKPGFEKMIPEYHKALLHHIKESAPQIDGYIIDSVYFGGGTPSYYGAGRLIQIFDALKKYGNVLVEAEVTVEVNPDSITFIDLVRLKKAGFNRLSIGAQCADDGILKSLHRRHTFAQVEETVQNARKAGFDNINIDLIYGLPSQTKEGWADTIVKTAALKPEHISGYGLKIEKGTELYLYKDSPFIPTDDDQADMYLYMIDALANYGYKQYEISNFAQRGRESRHNLKYWTGQEYIGFGAAAHSYVGGQRYSYIADIEGYCKRVAAGDTIVDQSEYMSSFELAGEYLMLRLRTVYGISEEEYCQVFPSKFDLIRKKLELFTNHGFMEYKDGRWHLTSKGFLVSNIIINEVLDAQALERAKIINPALKDDDMDNMQMSMFERADDTIELFNGIAL